jgi:hypothetical protein
MSDSLFQKIWKNSSRLSLVWAPYFPHFISILSDLKLDEWNNQGFTKLLCIQEGKMQSWKILSSKP